MLIVDIAGMGDEFYVLRLNAKDFDSETFLAEHEEDYMDLEEEGHDSLFAVDGELIFSVDLNGETVFETNEGKIGRDIAAELLIGESMLSWREFSEAELDEVAVIWGHSGTVGNMFFFNDVEEFDMSKLQIYADQRPTIDGTDRQLLFMGVTYDGNDPDDVQLDFVPKHGFWNPVIFLPE